MKKVIFIAAALVLMLASVDAFAWGRSGHDAVAAIAERHLTKKTKKAVEKILGGKSIVYYTKWADEVRKTPEFLYTDPWHVNYIDKDERSLLRRSMEKRTETSFTDSAPRLCLLWKIWMHTMILQSA